MCGEPEYRPAAVFPELTARDTTSAAAALQQVVVAVGLAVDRKLMTRERAVSLIGAIAGRLGVEIDAKSELENVAAESAEEQFEPVTEDEE